jgi:hypothetical protein
MSISHPALSLQRLAKLALYVAVFVLPGGFILMLALMWFFQRQKRATEASLAS